MSKATGAMVSIQGIVRGCQGLRAAAAAHAAVDRIEKSIFEQGKGYQIMTHSNVLVCVFIKNLNHSLICFIRLQVGFISISDLFKSATL